VTTPPETDPVAPASAEPGASAPERRPRLDRRYLTGCAAGLLLGGALGLPGAYALLRIDAHVAGPCAPGPSPEALATQLAAGLRALAEREPARALDIFRQMERATPGDPKVHNNLCVALNELGRYSEAVSSCKEAIALDPGFTLAKNNLAWARAQRDRTAPPGVPAVQTGR
jgi:tetratricopeptide (TPR) repeat protein